MRDATSGNKLMISAGLQDSSKKFIHPKLSKASKALLAGNESKTESVTDEIALDSLSLM